MVLTAVDDGTHPAVRAKEKATLDRDKEIYWMRIYERDRVTTPVVGATEKESWYEDLRDRGL